MPGNMASPGWSCMISWLGIEFQLCVLSPQHLEMPLSGAEEKSAANEITVHLGFDL